MYQLNDPPLPYVVNEYAFFSVLVIALLMALWRPWHRSWRFERTGWFFGTVVYSVVVLVVAARTPYPYPNVGGFGVLIWAVALLAFFLGLFQRPSLDPNVSYTKRADVVLALFSAFVLCFVLLPGGGHPREAHYQTECRNNLKLIMLAHFNEHDEQQRFPASSEGDPPHSWRVRLLPWLDQKPLFSQYQFAATWDSTENLSVATTPMAIFQCPSRKEYVGTSGLRDQQHRYFSHYARLTGAHSAGDGISLKEITDGTSNTIMVVEACGVDRVWTNPVDVDIDSQPLGINLPSPTRFHSPGRISSHHTGGAHVALADGSVRFVNEKIDPKLLRALVTINGNEPVGDF